MARLELKQSKEEGRAFHVRNKIRFPKKLSMIKKKLDSRRELKRWRKKKRKNGEKRWWSEDPKEIKKSWKKYFHRENRDFVCLVSHIGQESLAKSRSKWSRFAGHR